MGAQDCHPGILSRVSKPLKGVRACLHMYMCAFVCAWLPLPVKVNLVLDLEQHIYSDLLKLTLNDVLPVES